MAETLIPVRVARVDRPAPDVAVVELRHADDTPLPAFTAGAHVDVHLPGGAVRPYSICNDEVERDRYVIAVRRRNDGRGGSIALHDHVRPGAVVTIGAPRNLFELERDAAPVLLLAGGIGITPLLAMARVLHRQGRGFHLDYSVHDRATAAFADELDRGPFAGSVRIQQTGGPEGARLDFARLAGDAPAGARVYACGPEGFMAAAVTAFRARPDITVRTEHFGAAPQMGAGFRVTLARQGVSLEVEDGGSILEALRRHGLDPEVSCEQGVCGTCVARVLSGEIEHHDYVLTPAERASGDRMLICVSRGRPGGTLVLDL